MAKWITKKIQNYMNKRKIKKLPIWCRQRITLDRGIVLGDKPILAHDFSKQISRNKKE